MPGCSPSPRRVWLMFGCPRRRQPRPSRGCATRPAPRGRWWSRRLRLPSNRPSTSGDRLHRAFRSCVPSSRPSIQMGSSTRAVSWVGFSGELMAKLATLDFKAQLQRDGVPPPAAGIDMDLVRDCIHCGLCLPKCPTFRTLDHEGDSPRGRMWQIKEATLGLVAFDDPRFQAHIYQCFNCRACETACPSGVQFGTVMEMARAKTPPQNRRDRMVRAVLLNGLLPHPRRLRIAGWLYRATRALRLPALLRRSRAWKILPLGKFAAFPPEGDTSPSRPPLPALTPAQGPRRARVGLLTGCIQDEMFRGTNRRTTLALARNGCDVIVPSARVCCGALASHAGEAKTAEHLAGLTMDAFTGQSLDAVVVNAAGCGSQLKEKEVQLRNDAGRREASPAFSRTVKGASEVLI